jgi:predicted transcriptional regulator
VKEYELDCHHCCRFAVNVNESTKASYDLRQQIFSAEIFSAETVNNLITEFKICNEIIDAISKANDQTSDFLQKLAIDDTNTPADTQIDIERSNW